MIVSRDDIQLDVPLADFPVTSLRVGLIVEQPVEIGDGDTEMTLSAGVSSGFTIVKGPQDSLFTNQFGGDAIAVEADTAYLAFEITPTLSASLSHTPSDLSFGFEAGGEIKITNWKLLSLTEEPTLGRALKETLDSFDLPSDVEDLTHFEPGDIFTVDGETSLKFSCPPVSASSPARIRWRAWTFPRLLTILP